MPQKPLWSGPTAAGCIQQALGHLCQVESTVEPEAMRQAIEAKDLGGQIFLSETHLNVFRVLKQAETLSQGYHVVVANPPDMGGWRMNGLL
jgi:hypothetical protein